MLKEITESTLSKAKEEVVIPQWVIAVIAVAAFLTGLVVGILCASGSKQRKSRKSFNADAYVRDLNFDIDDNADDFDFDDDDNEGFEFTF